MAVKYHSLYQSLNDLTGWDQINASILKTTRWFWRTLPQKKGFFCCRIQKNPFYDNEIVKIAWKNIIFNFYKRNTNLPRPIWKSTDPFILGGTKKWADKFSLLDFKKYFAASAKTCKSNVSFPEKWHHWWRKYNSISISSLFLLTIVLSYRCVIFERG